MYLYNRFSFLCTWNKQKIVNQLYFNIYFFKLGSYCAVDTTVVAHSPSKATMSGIRNVWKQMGYYPRGKVQGLLEYNHLETHAGSYILSLQSNSDSPFQICNQWTKQPINVHMNKNQKVFSFHVSSHHFFKLVALVFTFLFKWSVKFYLMWHKFHGPDFPCTYTQHRFTNHCLGSENKGSIWDGPTGSTQAQRVKVFFKILPHYKIPWYTHRNDPNPENWQLQMLA